MNLDDFIDFNRQLLATGKSREAPLERSARDRQIGLKLGGTALDEDEALLLGWKDNVAPAAKPSMGALLAGAFRWTAAALVLLGLSAGAGAAAALLRYDGNEPINVLFFLGAIIGVQLALLPLLVLSFVFRSRIRFGFRLVRSLVGGLLLQVFSLLSRLGLPPERAARIRADVGDLRSGNSLYSRVHPCLVLLLIQVFGVAFNAAVVGALFFYVVFSDLAFSWETTIQTEPKQVHRITTVLSVPWSGFAPQARPSLELVEATRFVRMDGVFATSAPDAAQRAGGWWPFLAAATICYGLLPRLLALVAGWALLRKEMRLALARSDQVQALRERLRTPSVRVGTGPADAPARHDESARPGPPAAPPEKGLALAVIFWAYDEAPPESAVSSLVAEGLAATVVNKRRVGGVDGSEATVLEQVRQEIEAGEIDGVAVFFEPFEPPKTDARRFLTRLRSALGPSAPVIVFLAEFAGGATLPVEERDRTAWRNMIHSVGDPFLMMHEWQDVS